MRVSTQTQNRMQRLAKAAHPLGLNARLTTKSHQSLPITVLAVSAVDIRLAADANPEIGEVITVDFPASKGDSAVSVRGVVHWTEMRGAEHEIGVFLGQKLPSRLEHLCASTGRQSERYRCRIPGWLDWGSNQPMGSATVVNYSYNGLALQSSFPAVIDEVFTFSWKDSGTPKSLTGVALWQIEQNGGYLVGCHVEPAAGLRIAGLPEPRLLFGN